MHFLINPATAIVLLLVRLSIIEPGSWSLAAGLEAVSLGLATVLAYVFLDIAMRKGNLVLVAVGDIEGGPKGDILGQAGAGIGTDPLR